GRHECLPDLTQDRPDIDQVAGTLLAKHRQDDARRHHRSEQVRLEDAAMGLPLAFVEPGEVGGARVVEPDVDAPPARHGLVAYPPEVGLAGDVGLHYERRSATGPA